jgi:transcriptional regulator GlxA family with amidase domain
VRTLLLGFEACVHLEVAAAISLLAPRYPLLVASPDGRPFRVAEGLRLVADVAYAQVPTRDVAAALVPGGDCEAAVTSPDTAPLLQALSARGVPIGGICHGALVLAAAGVLRGRRCTHVCTTKYAPGDAFEGLRAFAGPRFAESRYEDENVVVDAHLVTAKPWAHLEFAAAMSRVAGLSTAGEAAAAVRSLRGQGRRAERHGYRRYVIALDRIPGVETDESVTRAHVRWLRQLEADGRLVAGGPFTDGAGGLVIIAAADHGAAMELAETDPFVRAGVRRLSVREWQLSCEENDHLGLS